VPKVIESLTRRKPAPPIVSGRAGLAGRSA